MTASQILSDLRALGSDPYKKILLNHGVREPVFGVKVEALKKIRKQTGKDYRLALDLYDTGVYDAMYLAGLVADESKMTKKDLRHWLAKANCDTLCGSTVPWVTAESPHGWDLALEWIDSKKESAASAGWETLSSLVATKADADLDLPRLKELLRRVEQTIHTQPDRVRYSMNGFVIAVGSHVAPLADAAMKTAQAIGTVSVDVGNTACKVPSAPDYIKKSHQRGSLGKKRKSARC